MERTGAAGWCLARRTWRTAGTMTAMGNEDQTTEPDDESRAADRFLARAEPEAVDPTVETEDEDPVHRAEVRHELERAFLKGEDAI